MSNSEQLRFDIVADDNATKIIDGVIKKVDKLEGDSAEVEISADDNASKTIDKVDTKTKSLDGTKAETELSAEDKASQRVDDVIRRVSALDGQTATTILQAETRKAEAEIKSLTRLLADVDGDDATVVLNARDAASARLDTLQSKLRDLDGQRAEVEVDVDTSPFDRLTDMAGKLPGQLGQIGSAAAAGGPMAAAAAAATAIATGLIAVATEAKNSALEAAQLATFIGSSVEDASRLLLVLEPVGVELGDISDIVGQTTQVLSQQPDVVKRLGINLKGASPKDVFLDAYDAVLKVTDAQERLNLMNTLFGEQGARQVAAVITKYGDLREAMRRVSKERVTTDEDVNNARDLDKALNDLKVQAQEFATTLGQNLLPVLAEVVGLLNDIINVGKTVGDEVFGPWIGLADDFDTALSGAFGSADEKFQNFVGGVVEKQQVWRDQASLYGEMSTGLQNVGDDADDTTDDVDDFTSSLHGMGEAARDGKDDIDHLRTAWSDFRTSLDDKKALNDIGRQFDEVLEKGKAAFEASVTGADNAEAANRDYEDSFIDLQIQVHDYLVEVLKIPESVATEIVANLDKASADQINAWIKNLEDGITIPLFAKPPAGRIGAHIVWDDQGGVAQPGDITIAGERAPELLNGRFLTRGPTIVPPGTRVTSSRATAALLGGTSTTTTNITNIVTIPRGYRELDAATAAHRVAKRSGRIYARR